MVRSELGRIFCDRVETLVEDRKQKGITEKRIRWILYCHWAHALYAIECGPENAQYGFPPVILVYLRSLLPRNVKGEIFEKAYEVTIEEFVQAVTRRL
ncbi:uncharacterized protein [Ptychodera flava]|uniref:uncharacterized protein isoform X2 n=1 Tax=Ptychodera flava TaxID=63121 RepID=UPI003969FF58